MNFEVSFPTQWDIQPFETLFAEPTRNGLTRPKRVRGNGIKMVNMGEIFAFDRIFNQEMDRVPVTDKEYDKSILKEGDLLFARQSLTLEGAGKCSIVMTDEEMTFESHLIRARLQREKADPLFYYYLFKSKIGKELISSIVEQVAAAGIRSSDLVKLKVPVPSVLEQREISKILSSIDDKIELNNAINKNLEEMAQAIFKRWFVDFEFPNENGEPYKSSGGEFEESELGLIPKGWRVGTATEIFDVQSGGTPKTGNSEYWNGDIPFFTPKDCTNSFYVINTEKQITEVGLSKCNSKLYKAGTVFITARGTVGKLSIAGQDMAMNQSCYALVATKDFTQKYIFLQTQLLINAIKKNASGAVFDAITVSTFQSLKVVIPNIELVVKFDKVVESIFNSILKNINENQILSDSRDTLLPKLMSGEIRVPIEREYVQTAGLPMAAESIEQYSTT